MYENLIITPEKIELLKEQNFKCMRDKKTGTLLNVSYTEAGLKWTFDKMGRPAYYKYPDTVFTSHGYMAARFVGTMEINPDIIIEDFIPKNHFDPRNQNINRYEKAKQKAETLYCDKALRLMFPMNGGGSESLIDAMTRIKESLILTEN